MSEPSIRECPDRLQGVKRPYRKPQLERVMLTAEEVTLSFCKTPGGIIVGPNNTNCRGGPGGICRVHGT